MGGGVGWVGAEDAARVGVGVGVAVRVGVGVLCFELVVMTVLYMVIYVCVYVKNLQFSWQTLFPFSFRWRKSRKYKFRDKGPFSSAESVSGFKNIRNFVSLLPIFEFLLYNLYSFSPARYFFVSREKTSYYITSARGFFSRMKRSF